MTFKNTTDKVKIMLINPPDEIGVGEKRFSRVIDVFQPLGLGYIAAALENAGYEVKIIDAKAGAFSIDEIMRKIAEFGPNIIGLSVSTPDFCSAQSLASQIKSSGDYTLLIGGRHVSALPEETMQESCFDYGIVGEGERTVVELVDAISQGNLQQIPQIKGIVFRDGLKIVRTPPREYIEDLDTLPFPARHLFPPLSKYTRFYYKSSPLATIITSRGCPYQCTFCDRTVFGNRVRIRSIENVLDEIEMLVRDCGVREVNIVDDLFTMTPRRVEEFCHGLLSRKLKISWACFSRVDSVTPDILKTMKEAGCWMLGYGIESGNQRILDKIKKNVTLETIEKAVKWTRKMNIRTVGFFIFGLPGEDETSIRNTLRFANKLPLDRAAFSILLPLPGSELYKTTLTKGGIVQDTKYRYCGNLYLPEKLPYVAEGLSIDILREYRKKAYRDFYLRPAYIAKRFLVYHEFKGLLMRIKALIKVIF